MKRLVIGSCLLGLTIPVTSTAADKIYESVDAQGNRTFSDSVPTGAVATEAIVVPPAAEPDAEVEASRQRAEEAIRAADESQRQRDLARQQQRAANEAAQQRVRAAEANLAEAKAVREGDRQGLAGGGSRLTPEYHSRVKAAEQELQQAQEALKRTAR
jgi:flagellar biosynthesis/type III secretory pathway protein FliH